MTMPMNLVLVRHGESEGNIIQGAANKGDESYYEADESLVTVPDYRWRLTSQGVAQAKQAGSWISHNILQENETFDRFITSPYLRTRETAGNLGLTDAQWEENRSVRERFWGEIGSIPRSVFLREYPHNSHYKEIDPLYWAPPGGESISDVAENRVRNLLSTLHRENSEQNVIVVTHGEFIWASRLTIERWRDEEFVEYDNNPDMKIHNCQVIHYTRINPETGQVAPRLQWVRRMTPTNNGNVVEEWQEFGRTRYSNDDLLEYVETLPVLVTPKKRRTRKRSTQE